MDEQTDLNLYSPENLLEQAKLAPKHLGYAIVQFYVDDSGIVSKIPTSTRKTFFLSPSGGTLRDDEMNIVFYSAKFDLYKGYGKA